MLGWRARTLGGIALVALTSYWVLGLSVRDLAPSRGGLALAGELFTRALQPAVVYEGASVPPGTMPLPIKALLAAWRTLAFAACAIGLAAGGGAVLGLLGAASWWRGDPLRGTGPTRARFVGLAAARLLSAGMRSVHELLWAVLLLAAFGITPYAAIAAIAIPYAGTLAKVFAELIDEAPLNSADALRALGASPIQAFACGQLPGALPDLLAYLLYRFECALRSSAVLGFFGFPTLGYFVAASFENLHFGEVWTYLYALAALVIGLDAYSAALRRQLAR